MINTDIKGYFIQALYLFDETELREYMRKFEDETMVTGLLYLDNYDEALESVEEARRSSDRTGRAKDQQIFQRSRRTGEAV